MARGIVKFFLAERGWGAISCAELPPGEDAWVHFSMIDAPGYRSLDAGDEVEFDYERADQDSFRWRALWVRKSAAAADSVSGAGPGDDMSVEDEAEAGETARRLLVQQHEARDLHQGEPIGGILLGEATPDRPPSADREGHATSAE